jgi:ribosomal protein S18 acetylase RimI-like enzyme
MDIVIRPARSEDKPTVAAFTQGTFEWGDYIDRVFDEWVAESDGGFVVAEVDGEVVAVVRGLLLSEREAWFQGARVHPDHRRQGLGLRLNDYLREWARSRGAVVARLLVEAENHAARGQVERSGMRPVATFLRAHRTVGDASPAPAGNGGRRVRALEKLRRAHSSEAQPAYMSWGTSELARQGRGLFGVRWRFRRLVLDDLVVAALDESLWNARTGWVLATRRDNLLEVGWLTTGPDDAEHLLRAVTDLAVDAGADRVQALIPDVPWLTQAARKANYSLDAEIIFAVSL